MVKDSKELQVALGDFFRTNDKLVCEMFDLLYVLREKHGLSKEDGDALESIITRATSAKYYLNKITSIIVKNSL